MLPIIVAAAVVAHTVGTSATIAPTAPSLGISSDITDNWAMYSPWHPAGNTTALPSTCSITQAIILQRHGARYPSKSDYKSMKATVKALQGASEYTNSDLDFLNDYKLSLGEDNLVPYGAAQSYDAGAEHYETYGFLVNASTIPFIRSDSEQRCIDSATNWTAGFTAASNNVVAPVLNLILDNSLNDTLDDAMCPNVGTPDSEIATWQDAAYPNITARINSEAPGADIANADVSNMFELCALETVAYEKPSNFCAIFQEDEFPLYEYEGDVKKYYETGYGQALGPVQGVGYVNELIARLTDQPVNDTTQTNYTLDHDPATFPLGLPLYADFSHDSQMIAIFSAIGLFNQSAAISPTTPNPDRTWIASNMTPFSSRMITEKVVCDGSSTEYVRILVNDVVQPLYFCNANEYGLCTLDAFVASQTFATSSGDGLWPECGWTASS